MHVFGIVKVVDFQKCFNLNSRFYHHGAFLNKIVSSPKFKSAFGRM